MVIGDEREFGYYGPGGFPPGPYVSPESYIPPSTYTLPSFNPPQEPQQGRARGPSIFASMFQMYGARPGTTQTQAETPKPNNENWLIVFHIFSILFCLLSIPLTPLIEIIPMLWAMLIAKKLKAGGILVKTFVLAFANVLITALVAALWGIVILICSVPTLGLCLIMLFVLIPYTTVLKSIVGDINFNW